MGILRKDKNWAYTTLPFVLIGTLIAFYHTLLQWNIIPNNQTFCNLGVSCTTVQINFLGFITIPFMSLLSFIAIGAFTIIYKKSHTNQ